MTDALLIALFSCLLIYLWRSITASRKLLSWPVAPPKHRTPTKPTRTPPTARPLPKVPFDLFARARARAYMAQDVRVADPKRARRLAAHEGWSFVLNHSINAN